MIDVLKQSIVMLGAFKPSSVMLSVVVLSVVMLSFVAPAYLPIESF